MSKQSRLAISAALRFLALGGGSLFTYQQHECPHYYRRFLRRILMRPYSPGTDLEFRWRMSGSGATKDGASFDDSEYVSTDCVPISVIHYTFPSPEAAAARANGETRSARAVLSKEASPQDNLASNTERVVLFTRRSNPYKVLRRTGNRLMLIESPSLKHALEYERRLFGGNSGRNSGTGTGGTGTDGTFSATLPTWGAVVHSRCS